MILIIIGFIFITAILVALSVAANGYSVHNIHKNTMPSANHSHSIHAQTHTDMHASDRIMLLDNDDEMPSMNNFFKENETIDNQQIDTENNNQNIDTENNRNIFEQSSDSNSYDSGSSFDSSSSSSDSGSSSSFD